LRMLEESVVNLDEAVRVLVKKATRQIWMISKLISAWLKF
jgi:hypothetical protein